MNKKELEQKLNETEQKLQSLGDLSALIQDFNSKKQEMEALILSVQNQKTQFDEFSNSLPEKQKTLHDLLESIEILKNELNGREEKNKIAEEKLLEIQLKTNEINNLSLEQLGKIANEKLSNSFDNVKKELKNSNKKWFGWLLGTSILLLASVVLIVFWQTKQGDSIFEISFLVKIALTFPIIFFEFFVNREYSRSQRLIEEYEFKSSVARSLEAYKEIVVGLFDEKEGDEFKKKLDFILEAIGGLYSSPMANIKNNGIKEIDLAKAAKPIVTSVKEIISAMPK
ncbi:MAG TPA: hypothetical protein DCS08_03540 [Candidatus Moranbacteria bacterium]|nr:MAG: hypothetical protein US27_C0022G0006 [Candidatus Moranbacteria bacterium GW2011_GWF1_36_78]HAT74053.1 hypothetical protein [Candidatus Moranbacteria bacterium]HBY11309.1 hypothetical protein [Candidatus Moranbacteria bacterium]